MSNTTDPEIVPAETRDAALEAALEAVQRVTEAAGYRLDYFARCELLDVELDRRAADLSPRPN